MMGELEKAEQFFNEGKVEESLSIIRSEMDINGESFDFLLLKAKNQYKLQLWGDCLNTLNKVLAIDKNCIPAQNYKKMVMNIVSFWNKDSFNP